MLEIKKKQSNIHQLSRELESCKDTRSLVGVNFETTLTNLYMRPEPRVGSLQVNKDTNHYLLDLFLRPLPSEMHTVNTMGEGLEIWGLGFLDSKYETPMERTSYQADTMLANTALSNIQTLPLCLIFGDPIVKRQSFKVMGVAYDLYTLTNNVEDELNTPTIEVTLLIKDREADMENLFTGLLGKTLGRTDTNRVMSLFTECNLTSLIPSMASLETRSTTVDLNVFQSDITLISLGSQYVIQHVGGQIMFNKQWIVSSEVKHQSGIKTEWVINLKGGDKITLLLT